MTVESSTAPISHRAVVCKISIISNLYTFPKNEKILYSLCFSYSFTQQIITEGILFESLSVGLSFLTTSGRETITFFSQIVWKWIIHIVSAHRLWVDHKPRDNLLSMSSGFMAGWIYWKPCDYFSGWHIC